MPAKIRGPLCVDSQACLRFLRTDLPGAQVQRRATACYQLARGLFLWLAMLGAAGAFRRAEHRRMTAVVASARPAMRAYLDLVATAAALAFLLLIAWPAYEYAYEESFITTPALQIANIGRAAALPVGIGLMALFARLRLARAGDVRTVLAAVVSVVA